jgi:hypothetical protein
MTDVSGNAAFTATLPVAAPGGYRVTATATDAAGNTSEFSMDTPVTDGPQTVSLSITSSGTIQTISWPAAATLFALESTDTLGLPSPWQTVTSGIMTVGQWKQLVVTNEPATASRFFRLRKP